MICILSLTTSLLIFAQSEDVPTPAKETPAESQQEESIDPAEALAKVKAAIKSDSEVIILDAIDVCGAVKDKKVISELYKLLKHKSEEIRFATLTALRFNDHPEALKRLLSFGKDKRIKNDDKYHEAYIYALGQKADKKTAKIIKDDLVLVTSAAKEVLAAKIFALGRVRQVDSIETLLQFCQSGTRNGRRRGGTPRMRIEVQTSLAILTGVELGNQVLDWTNWWSDNKRGFKISKTEGTISNPKLQAKWQALWLSEEQKSQAKKEQKEKRSKKRKDDGKDEEGSSSTDF
ncbi:MAG: HEAT repeat domain-containing protein [Planctomycetes bacterium]|nr:HEAT repeat domain-containing protein [Planctomycetota bacterium]